ncbi:MAG: cobalt transporter CbiM [Lachnospiraceae bacterium]
MHIPDHYLSPSTCGVLGAAMIPVWAISIKKVKEELPKEKIPLLGIGAAFSFLGMMFNIPLPGGTTGHAVGGTLIAALCGPYAACISVTIALLVQALLFGDGGILAFGANCFNMAFVLPFVGYAVYQFLRKKIKGRFSDQVAAAVGSYLGINAAALCAAIEFGIQPLLFQDAAGHALYCPYPLSVSVPAMMIGHLTLFGLAEVVFTVAILTFMKKTAPDAGYQATKKTSKAVYLLLGALIVCTPLGLLAAGTAWGEWGIDEISEVVSDGSALGYTPQGMASGFEFSAFFPDYTVAGLPEWFGYILSAVIGAAIVVIFFKIISSMKKNKVNYD